MSKMAEMILEEISLEDVEYSVRRYSAGWLAYMLWDDIFYGEFEEDEILEGILELVG